MKKTGGLGKGFDALLPVDFDTNLLVSDTEKILQADIKQVVPNPGQPRREFDEEALNGLASSIKQYGILQPIVVTPAKAGNHEIIAGERRWRAAQLAGLSKVPVIVRSGKEHERLELALIENVQRVDLSPLEQAASIEHLHSQFNLAYETIAKRLGKANSTVVNSVRLLQLPAPAVQALKDRQITEGHARQILALKDDAGHQQELLNFIINNGWSVRQAERYVTSIKQGHVSTTAARARVSTETPATRNLSQRLGTTVSVRRTAKGGRLEIAFKTDEELEAIMQHLG